MFNKRFKLSIQVFLALIFIINSSYALTRQQFKKAAKLMKRSCMPKAGVTEEEIGEIEQGKFLEQRNVMCYMACIYSMGSVIKNNMIQYDLMIKQVDTIFPNEVREDIKAAVTICRDYMTTIKDLCEASYKVVKCIYDSKPASFVYA